MKPLELQWFRLSLLQAIKIEYVSITELVFHAIIIKCTNRRRKASCFSQL